MVHYRLIIDTRRKKANDKFPVKLRVTCDRAQKYFSTGISLSLEDWEIIQSNKAKKALKETEAILDAIKVKAKAIIDSMQHFDFDIFEKKLFQKRTTKGALNAAFTDNIKLLRDQQRISTAISYEAALKSLEQFKANLDFKDITPSFLNDYEEWMIGQGRSTTTVGMYLRALRAVFNQAISAGQVSQGLYPFGKRKYLIPTGVNIKKALNSDELKKLFEYVTDPYSSSRKALDFWIFSYLCQGMNTKDIALLKFKNISDGEIHFQRAKTQKTTKANPKIIRVFISKPCQQIIDRWRNEDNSDPDNYVFPILRKGMSAQQQYAAIQQFTKTINKYVDRIAKELGIEKKVRTYSARHSYSTMLKTKGASIEYIAESLGHTNIATTQSYLDSFDNNTKKLWAEKLIEF